PRRRPTPRAGGPPGPARPRGFRRERAPLREATSPGAASRARRRGGRSQCRKGWRTRTGPSRRQERGCVGTCRENKQRQCHLEGNSVSRRNVRLTGGVLPPEALPCLLFEGTAMFQRILIPLDGSEIAEAILVQVRRLLSIRDAEVVLLQAVPIPVQPGLDYAPLLTDLKADAEKYI